MNLRYNILRKVQGIKLKEFATFGELDRWMSQIGKLSLSNSDERALREKYQAALEFETDLKAHFGRVKNFVYHTKDINAIRGTLKAARAAKIHLADYDEFKNVEQAFSWLSKLVAIIRMFFTDGQDGEEEDQMEVEDTPQKGGKGAKGKKGASNTRKVKYAKQIWKEITVEQHLNELSQYLSQYPRIQTSKHLHHLRTHILEGYLYRANGKRDRRVLNIQLRFGERIWTYQFGKLAHMDWHHQPMHKKFCRFYNDALKYGVSAETNEEYAKFHAEFTHFQRWTSSYDEICSKELKTLLMSEDLAAVFQEIQKLLLNKPTIRIVLKDRVQNLTQIGLWVQWKLKVDSIFAQIEKKRCNITAQQLRDLCKSSANHIKYPPKGPRIRDILILFKSATKLNHKLEKYEKDKKEALMKIKQNLSLSDNDKYFLQAIQKKPHTETCLKLIKKIQAHRLNFTSELESLI